MIASMKLLLVLLFSTTVLADVKREYKNKKNEERKLKSGKTGPRPPTPQTPTPPTPTPPTPTPPTPTNPTDPSKRGPTTSPVLSPPSPTPGNGFPTPDGNLGVCACSTPVYFRFETAALSFRSHVRNAASQNCVLASINSPEEQAAAILASRDHVINSWFPVRNDRAYIGGIRADVVANARSQTAQEGGWRWTDNTPFFEGDSEDFSFWSVTGLFEQPDNFGGFILQQNVMTMYLRYNRFIEIIKLFGWNDSIAFRQRPALYKCCDDPVSDPPIDFSQCRVTPLGNSIPNINLPELAIDLPVQWFLDGLNFATDIGAGRLPNLGRE